MIINNISGLKSLQDIWRFNPKFIECLFYLTDESYDTTNLILETFDSNPEFIEDWEENGFKETMTDLLVFLKITNQLHTLFWEYEMVDNILVNYNDGMNIPKIN